MSIFNSKINEIKNKYTNYKDFIDEYFIKYKSHLFESGYYNYNALPIDCKANSYLENYNLFLKKNLGKKYNLNWDIFINFLKEESDRIRNKLTLNTKKNFIKKSKETKFNLEKYNQRRYNNSKFINLINNNNIKFTNYSWLKYKNNSCRYDVFCTFYIFVIFDYMEDIYDTLNENLKCIHNLMRDIKQNPIEEKKK